MNVEIKKISCPFCEKSEVRANYYPSTKTEPHHHFVKKIVRSKERYEILDDCTNCGKTKKEIQEKMRNPNEAPKNEDILKRLRDAGLPTKI